MVLFCVGSAAHKGKCRPSVNNASRSKNKAKRCRHVWMGPGYYFMEGVVLTKASVSHPSIMIGGQKTRPSNVDMCGLDQGTVLSRVWG